MPIVKAGFKQGFRGRSKQASWSRRAHYLTSEHDREKALAFDKQGVALKPDQAIESMGGKDAEYHEVIISPSLNECKAIEAQNSESKEESIREAGRRIAETYANGRPYVYAVHWSNDDRFHYHLAVKGAPTEKLLGKDGKIQQVWDDNWRVKTRRPIVDSTAHKEFLALKKELGTVQLEQRSVQRDVYREVKAAKPEERESVFAKFKDRQIDLVERRFNLEVRSIDARYASRKDSGSWEHKVELEQATFRRSGGLNTIENFERQRVLKSEAWKQTFDYAKQARSTVQEEKALKQEFKVAIKDAPKELQEGIRDTFQTRRMELIERRASLEFLATTSRHSARGTLGSDSHQVELGAIETKRQASVRLWSAEGQMEHHKGGMKDFYKDRSAAIKAAPKEERPQIKNEWRGREVEKLEERHTLDVKVVQARHEAWGKLGTPEHAKALSDASQRFDSSIERFRSREELREAMQGIQDKLRALPEERREALAKIPEESRASRERVYDKMDETERKLSESFLALEVVAIERKYSAKAFAVPEGGGGEGEKKRLGVEDFRKTPSFVEDMGKASERFQGVVERQGFEKELREVRGQLHDLRGERQAAMETAPWQRREAVAAQYSGKDRDLTSKVFDLEGRTLDARHKVYGSLGSEGHQGDRERLVDRQGVTASLQALRFERGEALKAAPLDQRATVGRGYDQREAVLVERRYTVEVKAANDIHRARGSFGGDAHKEALAKAEDRKRSSLNAIQGREYDTRKNSAHLPKALLTGRVDQFLGNLPMQIARAAVRGMANGIIAKGATGDTKTILNRGVADPKSLQMQATKALQLVTDPIKRVFKMRMG